MARDSELNRASPTLHGILCGFQDTESDLRASRRSWLGRLDAFRMFPEVMAVWRQQAEQLLPDPGQAHKSQYHEHATWLAVVFELDRDAYDRVHDNWRQVHRRRRNLWKAISSGGLPL